LTVDTPFRGYEKFTGLVEHTFVDVNAFRTNVQLSGSAFNTVFHEMVCTFLLVRRCDPLGIDLPCVDQ
jgi:hypothetical protein